MSGGTIPLFDLRAFLAGELCLFDGPPVALVRVTLGWRTEGQYWEKYMVEPGQESDCHDSGVPGASACETEEAAIRLWAGWFLEQMPEETCAPPPVVQLVIRG